MSTKPTEGPGGEAGGASEAQPASAGASYGDAICITPYDENDPAYAKEITVTFGGNRQSKQWKPLTMPAGAFIAMLCKHKEGQKDGHSFVFGDMVSGRRLKTSVKALHGVGLDIDTGTPTETVDAALKKLGCLAVRYSTHSSGKTKTEIKKDKVVKFAGDREINGDLMREFLTTVELWDPSIIETVEYLGTEFTENGLVCQITHAPMPKHRIAFPFEDKFTIEDEAPTQAEAMKKWAKVPEALARLLNVPFDTSCTDPSRLFYLPRHAKGKPFDISLFGGPYFDWRKLELNDPMEKLVAAFTKGKSKSVTDEGRELGRWSLKRAHGFQIADVIDAHAPDRIRHNTRRGYEIECPFDEDHNDAGNQEDRACLVVNAGEGPSEFFMISCRHESCRNKTNLDMLGKMLKDGWFDKSVIDEDQFNAILEDEDKPEVAVKIEKQDKAKLDYGAAIDALTPPDKSNQNTIENVVKLVLDAGVSVEAVRKTMAKKLDARVSWIDAQFKKVRAAARTKTETKDHRETFEYYGDSYDFVDATDACKVALKNKNANDCRPTYSHINGAAVRLETLTGGRAKFADLNQGDFWGDLCELLLFRRVGDDGDGRREKVPEDVAKQVYTQARAILPPAPEVIYTPMFLRDGSLLIEPGYNKANNILLIPNGLNVTPPPLKPTKAQMEESLNYLFNIVLGEFPFLDVDAGGNDIVGVGPSRTHALASLVTPFMRRMFDGQTPCFYANKPQPGTGGSMLAKLPGLLVDGKITHIPYVHNDEEMSKILGAEVVTGTSSCIILENLTDFNNRTLLGAFTLPTIKTRLLGQSAMIDAPNNYNWGASGNNPVIKAEMARRLCWMHLNARMPDADVLKRPFSRDLEAFVLANRATIIHHILLLIRYWQANGSEPFTARTMGNFGPWAASVGGVLQACGVEGFLDNRAPVSLDMGNADEDEFLIEMHKRHGTSPVAFKALFAWAMDAQLAVLTGHNEQQQRANFARTVQICCGRGFEHDGDTFALRETEGGFVIKQVEPAHVA